MGNWFVRSRNLLQSLLPTLLQRFKQLVTDCPFSVVSNAKREPPSTGDETKNGRPFGLPFELPLLGSTASAQRE